ncbi:MAG TPA: hypothetical protein VI669_17080, partial [Vicinamibacteria bacterium]
MRSPCFGRVLSLLVVLLLGAEPAAAHTFAFTDVRVSVDRDRFEVDVACDLDALALGVPSSADSAALAAEIEAMTEPAREELAGRLTEFLTRRLRVRFDGVPAPFTISFPERGMARPDGALPSHFGLVAHLEGRTPEGARQATFFASRSFPLVRLAWQSRTGESAVEEVLEPGAESRPQPVAGPATAGSAGETAR